jgi:cobalamin biosynthesis protein CbiG
VGMLEGAVIEIKAIYVDAYSSFTIPIKAGHRGWFLRPPL